MQNVYSWKIINPVAIDVGADKIHETLLADGTPVSGKNVGVAVVDSGNYFDSLSLKIDSLDHIVNYLGQADFVAIKEGAAGNTCGLTGVLNKYDLNQPDQYCFFDMKLNSIDPYGHGSHVSGIISSGISDAIYWG